MSAHNVHNNHERAPKSVYFAAVIVIFFSSLSAADSIGFVPCQMDGTCSEASKTVTLADLPELGPSTSAEQAAASQPETTLPTRIKISAINLDLPVQNIESRDLSVLDEYLKQGPIRYVDSARLGERGNILIFGHSSRLPVVRNQMYKAFNRAAELSVGDTITLEGDGKDYLYSVISVRSVDVSDTTIDLSTTQGTKLTLVTCDTLTGKSARYVVEADFVGTYTHAQ